MVGRCSESLRGFAVCRHVNGHHGVGSPQMTISPKARVKPKPCGGRRAHGCATVAAATRSPTTPFRRVHVDGVVGCGVSAARAGCAIDRTTCRARIGRFFAVAGWRAARRRPARGAHFRSRLGPCHRCSGGAGWRMQDDGDERPPACLGSSARLDAARAHAALLAVRRLAEALYGVAPRPRTLTALTR